jgi:hypothetical protein
MGGRFVPKLTVVLGMELKNLQELFSEARRLTNHSEYVIVGSLSILGVLQQGEVPARMLMSIDVACYTRQDPERIHELKDALGAGSAFEATHGFYLDPISPKLPTLPEQWEFRLLRVALQDGIALHFLDPNDAAVSKYARCEPRDREWIRAGLDAGLISGPIVANRFEHTDFFDAEERERALSALAEDQAQLARQQTD